MYVQFNEDEKEIISVFAGPQDPDAWPNQGEVDEDDPRYIIFMELVNKVTI